MKEEFVKYLKSVGVTETLQTRVASIYKTFEEMCPDEITDIFVTDYIKNDMEREYESLWFFSEKFMMEAKKFITNENFDMMPFKKKILYWNTISKNYDFNEATEESRLNVHVVVFPGQSFADFKASRENCNDLRDIILKHIIPNLHE